MKKPTNKATLRCVIACLTIAAPVCLSQDVKSATVQPTPAFSGEQMFREYCAVCHGNSAKGDGPAASAMKKTPSNLTELQARNKGVFPGDHVYNIIKGDPNSPISHGTKDMPVWGSVLGSLAHGNSAEVQLRISNLVNYIKSIQVQK